MNCSKAKLFLTITMFGTALSTQAAVASYENSSADPIILITPDWKPVAPPEKPMASENKLSSKLEKNSAQSQPVVAPERKLDSSTPIEIQKAPVKLQSLPAMASPTLPLWSAATGSTLHKTILAWADKEKYNVIWDAGDLDYPIVSPLSFRGSFEEAITQIFALYEKAERKFRVEGWRPQRLIKITERSQLDAAKGGKSL